MAKRSILLIAFAVVLLLMLGLGMLESATASTTPAASTPAVATATVGTAAADADTEGFGEGLSMVARQLVWLAIALALGLGFCIMDYHRMERWHWLLYIIAAITLALCYVPHVGINVNGANRWIGLEAFNHKGIRVQPSEFAKLALILSLAAWYAKYRQAARSFWKGFLAPVLMLMLIAGLIGGELDLGTGILTIAVGLGIMVAGGARIRYILFASGAAVLLLGLMIATNDNRKKRFMAYACEIPQLAEKDFFKNWLASLTPKERDEIKEKARHGYLAKLAYGSGGIEGVGFGQGRMKLYSLPEAHTDFILAMVGEELGLRGTLTAVFAFVLIVIGGMCIASYAPDTFGKLLGFGLTMLFGLEGLMNMAVTTGVLPNKGLALPFVSYGGSSLIMAMISIGILCNIHRQGVHLTREDLPGIQKKNRWTPRLSENCTPQFE